MQDIITISNKVQTAWVGFVVFRFGGVFTARPFVQREPPSLAQICRAVKAARRICAGAEKSFGKQGAHPFVQESMQLFSGLSATDKAKVHFIHVNHTNPLLIENSAAQKEVTEQGFNVAKEGQVITF